MMSPVNSVLFLSGDDFKAKSIQVIRKTPEAYVKAGWKVIYIVARDSSNKGNYYYEDPIVPEGVDVRRFEIPGTNLLNKLNNKVLVAVLVRLRRYLAIIMLFLKGRRYLAGNKVDVLYGYEMPGFLAARLLKVFRLSGKSRVIARFQGVVFVREWLRRGYWQRKVTNAETFYGLRTSSDLCIMTNDGTEGDWVLRQLSSKHLNNLRFLVNGVDQTPADPAKSLEYRKSLGLDAVAHVWISVSRLDDHKRVDRCLRTFAHATMQLGLIDAHYVIVGEGAKRTEFEMLAESLGISSSVTFLGAVNQSEVKHILGAADVFISMYEGSNVGNPLIEAIQANKLIVTLNNGGTGNWIQHNYNGLIYDIDDAKDLQQTEVETIAVDVVAVLKNESEQVRLKANLETTRSEKIWSWEDRFKAELSAVEKLLHI
ncbi:glycosyltransferase family 4 protein [Chitinophaga horti]|uniref:Glycosyltransferase family 4 protein n=1 Tax=Chitinophaga horti TaxID=2920382 RepID=A0ABY6J1C1_9BACT|nr:glycosyltransferase family 4 protein [Chitinophaga horti]UYQ92422.1 glycosyltransferase family 4 protein [Chitinophaga horti]